MCVFSLESAKSAFLNLSILRVVRYSKKLESPNQGSNQVDAMDISALGSDVYSVRLKVTFISGKQKQKFYRVGVIR
jgi:hypothetical protein